MDFLKHLPINGNETEQLWNNLSDTSGFLAGDKPNGGDFIRDSLIGLRKDFTGDN